MINEIKLPNIAPVTFYSNPPQHKGRPTDPKPMTGFFVGVEFMASIKLFFVNSLQCSKLGIRCSP